MKKLIESFYLADWLSYQKWTPLAWIYLFLNNLCLVLKNYVIHQSMGKYWIRNVYPILHCCAYFLDSYHLNVHLGMPEHALHLNLWTSRNWNVILGTPVILWYLHTDITYNWAFYWRIIWNITNETFQL